MLNLRNLKFIFFLLLSFSSHHSNAVDPDNSEHLYSDAFFSVKLDEESINASGIQTQKLHTTLYNSEIETFATRVDLSSLFDVRKEYLTALANQTTANINYKQSQKDLLRLENLQRDKAISTRKLFAQKSQLKIDKANFISSKQLAETILLQARSKWGNILSQWFLSEEYPNTNMLKTQDKPLYLVYLPASLLPPLQTLSIHPFGVRKKAHTASLVSSAAIVSTQQTGTPFFYLSDQVFDTYHQRVVAWLPTQENVQSGFIIPESAIVWHLGQSYVYLQLDDGRFNRTKISHKKRIRSKAYFIQEPLHEGDVLVITGTQMLLSEEFRGLIPEEGDDDDDNN